MKLQANMKILTGCLGIVGIESIRFLNNLYVTEKILIQSVIGVIAICIMVRKFKKEK